MDSDVEIALRYEKEARQAIGKRIDRMQTMDRIKAAGWILVGLFLASNPQMVPFIKAWVE